VVPQRVERLPVVPTNQAAHPPMVPTALGARHLAVPTAAWAPVAVPTAVSAVRTAATVR
jgi:hypothetical protein